jgi:hypothetical protein
MACANPHPSNVSLACLAEAPLMKLRPVGDEMLVGKPPGASCLAQFLVNIHHQQGM